MGQGDLQVLSQMYQTARELVATKEQALQAVLAWGAALLIGATVVVQNATAASGGGVWWMPVFAWALLVVVSAATAFQYAGESANLARLGAYAHRIEAVISTHSAVDGIPLYEHWSKDTQHWIQQQLGFSGAAWALLVVAIQGTPFIFGSASARFGYWPILWVVGAVVSLVVPGIYGWHSSVRYDRAMKAVKWDAAAAAKRVGRNARSAEPEGGTDGS